MQGVPREARQGYAQGRPVLLQLLQGARQALHLRSVPGPGLTHPQASHLGEVLEVVEVLALLVKAELHLADVAPGGWRGRALLQVVPCLLKLSHQPLQLRLAGCRSFSGYSSCLCCNEWLQNSIIWLCLHKCDNDYLESLHY